MKPALALPALSILTITILCSTRSVTAALPKGINQPIPKFHAETGDITTIVGGGEFYHDELGNAPTYRHLAKWYVTVSRKGNSYIYSAHKQIIASGKKEREIRLAKGRLSKAGGKHFYRWQNGGTVYQVTWKPSDPNFARVRVFAPGGKEIFNQLMNAMGGGD
jgi:hypothetical protein